MTVSPIGHYPVVMPPKTAPWPGFGNVWLAGVEKLNDINTFPRDFSQYFARGFSNARNGPMHQMTTK